MGPQGMASHGKNWEANYKSGDGDWWNEQAGDWWNGQASKNEQAGGWWNGQASRNEQAGDWWNGQESNEEKRVHPSDKNRQAYSYAEFREFAKGDEKKAQRMWQESKPAQENVNKRKLPVPRGSVKEEDDDSDDDAWGDWGESGLKVSVKMEEDSAGECELGKIPQSATLEQRPRTPTPPRRKRKRAPVPEQ